MTKHITDSERLTQMTLNRKYMELEEKEREIKRLNTLLSCKDVQIREYQNSVKTLCRQINDLVLNQCNHAKLS